MLEIFAELLSQEGGVVPPAMYTSRGELFDVTCVLRVEQPGFCGTVQVEVLRADAEWLIKDAGWSWVWDGPFGDAMVAVLLPPDGAKLSK
jgi:hypothetical protein